MPAGKVASLEGQNWRKKNLKNNKLLTISTQNVKFHRNIINTDYKKCIEMGLLILRTISSKKQKEI